MSRQKSYCIINKGGYAYFPIKAKSGPYYDRNGRLATGYLAGMPNFFGGTVEENQSIYSTLIREVDEESQGYIEIRLNAADNKEVQNSKIMRACEELFSFSYRETYYYFYSFNADEYQPSVTISDFRNSNILELSAEASVDAKRREMSCILKIPVTQLHKNFDNFLDKCIEMGSEYLLDKRTITEHRDWNDEGTQNAFKEFCSKYGTGAIH